MKIWLLAIPLMMVAVACAPADDFGPQEMPPPQEQGQPEEPMPEQGQPGEPIPEPMPEQGEPIPPGEY